MNPKRIVIIDDDEELLGLLEDVLEDEGYVVIGYSSTQFTDVIESIQADVVILDVWFDDFDGGLMFAQALKIKPHLRKLPVILMSSDPDVREYAKRVKATAWLQKPLDFTQLLSAVKDVSRSELSIH